MAKVQSKFELHIAAGQATPAPPIGPILGQYGVNIGQFVKDFNDQTQEIASKFGGAQVKVPAKVYVYQDRSFSLEIKPPVTSNLILWKINKKWGSGEPNKSEIASLNKEDLEEIAEIKKPVMNTRNTNSIMNSIAGTAQNMGVKVEW